MLRGAPSALCNPPKDRQCCNPPQSAIRLAERVQLLEASEPGTALAQERPQRWTPKLWRGALCAMS
eukprot:9163054-Alexandrium_andersonii.AAC.1